MPYSTSPSNGRVNRVEKLIINLDTATPLTCAWDTCTRPARTPYQVRTHEHPGSMSCDYGQHMIYAFCSDGHRDYWTASSGMSARDLADRNQGRIAGMHSPGQRMTIR